MTRYDKYKDKNDRNMTTLHWDDLVSDERQQIHMQRALYRPGFAFHAHKHDFAELFFIEQGTGLHNWDGQRHKLQRGNLVLVSPDCEHFLQAAADATLQIINIAISGRHHADLIQRYGEHLQLSAWANAAQHWQLPAADHLWFLQAVQDLEGRCEQALYADAFLLNLMQRLHMQTTPRSTLPNWLEDLFQLFDQPRYFVDPIAQMCERCGKGREYISRRIKQYTGLTAIEFVNKKRMDYAARLLMETGQAIEHIIEDCGFKTHAQFYRLFKRAHGVTPKAFRKHHQLRAI